MAFAAQLLAMGDDALPELLRLEAEAGRAASAAHPYPWDACGVSGAHTVAVLVCAAGRLDLVSWFVDKAGVRVGAPAACGVCLLCSPPRIDLGSDDHTAAVSAALLHAAVRSNDMRMVNYCLERGPVDVRDGVRGLACLVEPCCCARGVMGARTCP